MGPYRYSLGNNEQGTRGSQVVVEEQSPGFREFLGILWSRKWILTLVTLFVVGVALAYSVRQTPIYRSTAEVLVRPVTFDPTQPTTGGFVRMATERRVAASSAVAQGAAERLPQGTPMAALSVEATQDVDTLVFKASSPDPVAAQASAQAFAESYLDFRKSAVLQDLLAARQPIEEEIKGLAAQIGEVQARLFGPGSGQLSDGERATLQVQFTSLLNQRSSLQSKLNDLTAPDDIRIGEVLEPALLPTDPSSPDHRRTGAFALFAGLALGVGLAFLREVMDEKVRDRGELEEITGLPVLAVIPAPRRKRADSQVVTASDPSSELAEAYKALRTSLLIAASRNGWGTLLVTSAAAGEGKTFTVANLGVALAQAGKRVAVVSADFRKPALQNYLSVSDGVGLGDVLANDSDLQSALSPVAPVPNLWIVPSVGPAASTHRPRGAWSRVIADNRLIRRSGLLLDSSPRDITGNHPTGSSGELLGSERMREILAELKDQFDFVLLDTPPVLGIADTMALAPLADATVLVVDAARASRTAIQEALYRLGRVDARVIGALLTKYEPGRSRTYRAYRGRIPASPDLDGAHGRTAEVKVETPGPSPVGADRPEQKRRPAPPSRRTPRTDSHPKPPDRGEESHLQGGNRSPRGNRDRLEGPAT